ncbi:MAG TPA: iron-containing alcohol dehydrogenase [Dehalococcoidia bacterium]|nr:iron-containing alcohol dehydrogenase [Dehalococcoidia bacterium]
MTTFSFAVPTRVAFGAGVRRQIPEVVRAQGWRRVGLAIDHNLADVAVVQELIAATTAACDGVVTGYCRVAEPTYDALDAARGEYVDQQLDALIAVGGGSALDFGKAMAALVHNPEPALAYRGFEKLTGPVLPIVAVPTTAGTGSEVTPNASFVDAREQRKMGINGEAVRPRFAFLDPDLTASCPRAAAISAAVDSLVHATEAYVAKKSNPMARLFAREGFGRVFNALPALASAPDAASREQVMFGAFLAGVALMHSGTGPAAAMSYPLGVRYKVPHGYAGGTFLPFVVAHNAAQGADDYADLYDVIQGADPSASRQARAAAFADRLHGLMRDLDVFRDPAALGLTGPAVDRFVADTLELSGALEQNPVPFGAAEIKTTIDRLSTVRGARA